MQLWLAIKRLAGAVSRKVQERGSQGKGRRIIAPLGFPVQKVMRTAVRYWAERNMAEEKLRILIVDDDRQMVRTLCDIFKLRGYEAEAAYSGPEALQKMDGGQYHCILSDIRMPGMTGVELCQTVNATHPGLPVLLMTAYSDIQLAEVKESAIATLSKPLDIELVLNLFSWVAQSFSLRMRPPVLTYG